MNREWWNKLTKSEKIEKLNEWNAEWWNKLSKHEKMEKLNELNASVHTTLSKNNQALGDWFRKMSETEHAPEWLGVKEPKQQPSDGQTEPEKEKEVITEKEKAHEQVSGEEHIALAKESLRQLLEDQRVPESIRETLREDYRQLEMMLDKLENEQVHIAVFGRVSVGKSSLLNVLLGQKQFGVSVLHGETKVSGMAQWQEYDTGGVFLIDTPGINEVDGEAREKLAHDVAARADLLLFVIDGDITETELTALKTVAEYQRPIILALNKADRYSQKERITLHNTLRKRTAGLVAPENIVQTIAQESTQTVIYIDGDGEETESVRHRPADIFNLKSRLWDILDADGRTLSALNAGLFAGHLSEQVAQRMLQVRRQIGEKIIRLYCIAKGVAVGLNPIPLADLFAAGALDISMIVHLSKIYGLPITRSEATKLITVIMGQMIALMGVVWAIDILSSALKLATGGLSTVVTAATQGAIAWYATLVIGKAAETWLANGKSWGEAGPKLVVQQILDNLDRNSVLAEAREEILSHLRRTVKN